MCGIAGQIGWDERYILSMENGYRQMLEAITNSEITGEGMYLRGNAALLRAGYAPDDEENAPMEFFYEGECYILAFDGELYNTSEIRRELKLLGHSFKTRSHTEVVGHAYIEWGRRCVERFNGDFAFAVWEERARHLFLARDRLGVKPMFYTQKRDSLIFASEIRTLLKHPGVEAVLDSEGVAELVFLGPDRTPGRGVLRGIEELPPGFIAEYDEDGFRKWRYWDLVDGECNDSFAYAAEKTRFLVLDTIQRQLAGDVPVCTFLSGGLNASVISSVADGILAEQGRRLHTFSVGYRDYANNFDYGVLEADIESFFIGIMNDSLEALHHNVILDTRELVPGLYEAAVARGLPGMADLDSSFLLLCREAKAHTAVALTGDCADELFGGRPWYRDEAFGEHEGFPWARLTKLSRSVLREEFCIDGAEYVESRCRKTLSEVSVAPLNRDERHVKEMMSLSYKWYMQTQLDSLDRMSRYSGLHIRVPFCDYRLFEYLYTVPWAYKEYNNTEKGLLREAMRGLLPVEVLERAKSPYPKTHNPSYMRAVSSHMRRVLEDGSSPVLKIVKREALEALLRENTHLSWYGQQMTTPQAIAYFLQVNHWMESFNVRVTV